MRVRAALAREREQRAWTLRLAGVSQADIGRQLGVTESAVSFMLKRLLARTDDDLRRGVSAHRAVVFARLEALYAESYKEWRDGCAAGRANFKLAQTAIRALSEQSRLLGLQAPQRIELEAPEPQQPEPPVDLSALTDAEVIQLRDLVRKAKGDVGDVRDVTPTNGAVPTVRRFTQDVQ